MSTETAHSSTSLARKVVDPDCGYQLVRKAGPYEVLTHLFHELGIQSNILVSARYSHPTSKVLTPVNVYQALRTVIREHPALSIIGVSQLSDKKEGNHRLWEARLPFINLQHCVEFVETREEHLNLACAFEKIHNEWFDAKDTSRPWWKLLVLNRVQVTLVYHHSIGDGISGFAFHRSFLAALNTREAAHTLVTEGFHIVESPELSPPLCPLYEIEARLSWLYVIYNFIFWNVIRSFVNHKHFLFSDAIFSKTYPTAAKPFPVEDRTITKVKILRISKETMEKSLTACHNHTTSFTALLHTLIHVTLAADIYPKARIGFSRLAVNIRPLLKVDPGPDSFTNAASQYGRAQLLGTYRKAGSGRSFSANLARTHDTIYRQIPRLEACQGL